MSIKELNEKLADTPYVAGYTPSQLDLEELKKLPAKYDEFQHVKRWASHMASFSEAERKAFPGAPAPAAKKGGDDDDDDFELFGSDEDEEAEAAKEKRRAELASKKKAGKPAAKSSVVIDVKVWDDETDLKLVESKVREIQKDGLLWGAAKTVPLAFGVSKLQIGCVIEDDKISTDWICETIEAIEGELVQSTDIAAFQKI